MRILIPFITPLLLLSCIDRINIATPEPKSQLVVDGYITDEPGPYTVKLSFASPINGFLKFAKPFAAKKVTISDNAGNSEILEEKESGTYQTKPSGIRGVVGREYFITIETFDGLIYESLPDRLNPVGKVDSVYYELVITQPIDNPIQYGLRVLADGTGNSDDESFYRWKLTETFMIETSPTSCPEGGCTCCTCWVTGNTNQVVVTDNLFVSKSKFKGIDMGYVPIEYFSFLRKYRLEVKQMSLSSLAYKYWSIIRSQKEGASNLFQPVIGKARTNIFEKNGIHEALGIFYASSVTNKQIYVTNYDVKVRLKVKIEVQNLTIDGDCRTVYPNSSNMKPTDWLD